MSVSSAGSCMSVSYCGSEVALEVALDDIYQKLQDHLNKLHCCSRTMAMLSEQETDQDADFKECAKYNDVIVENVDGMADLFKELKSISKEILGKPPTPDLKLWYTNHLMMIKEEKRVAKDAETAKKALEKVTEEKD